MSDVTTPAQIVATIGGVLSVMFLTFQVIRATVRKRSLSEAIEPTWVAQSELMLSLGGAAVGVFIRVFLVQKNLSIDWTSCVIYAALCAFTGTQLYWIFRDNERKAIMRILCAMLLPAAGGYLVAWS